MKKSRIKVGYRFCGNCNPLIDAPKLLEKLKELDGGFEYVYWEEGGYDAVLILSGCRRDCTEHPADADLKYNVTAAGASLNGKTVNEELMADRIFELLTEWNKGAKYMKILAYSCRTDETEFFRKFSEKYNVEVKLTKEAPSIENVHLAEGCDCVSIITSIINAGLLKKFQEAGVSFISTRTIGYDHIDMKSAEELGISVGNITYSPGSVADYAVMLILMAIRNIKAIMDRSVGQDYSLKGFRGRELHNLTVGVIGTGRIGKEVIKNLSGFGCRILAYDLHGSEEVKKYAESVSLEKLYAESDIITFHVPATGDNYHMINKYTISSMKDGVIIINTSRGSVIDTWDFIEAVERGKIGGAALDVIENESDIYYNDLKCKVLDNREFAILKAFPNVIVTPHMAFYTDQAVSDMVENSILSCISFMNGK